MKRTAFVFFLAILCPFLSHAQSARKGVLDLRQYNFQEERPIELNGEWEFYMMQLHSPNDFKNDSALVKDYIDFPSTWNETSKAQKPGHGFATYFLRLIVKAPQKLAIELPHFYSSYSFWINGINVAKNGTVGRSPETSTPQWLPQVILYDAEQDTLDMVIHASNFSHAMGGVREPIRIGLPEKLITKHSIAVTGNIVLCGTLLVLATTFILIFLFFKQDRAALYFSALALTWALREAFSNLYVVTAIVPDFPWEIAVKIEYLALYFTMVWAALFLDSVFIHDVSALFKYFFVTCNIIFALLTSFSSANFFTQFLPVYLSFAGVLLLYVLYVLIRAIIRERQGVWLIVTCMMLGVIVFAYDIIAYEGLMRFNSIVTYGGYIVMFLLMGLTLTFQFGIIKRKTGRRDMLTYEDLYGGK